jgi:hypothetical protein
MRGFENIYGKVIVKKDRTSHRCHAYGLPPYSEMVDGFRNQSVGDAMMAPWAEVKRHVDETLGSFENLFHFSLQEK